MMYGLLIWERLDVECLENRRPGRRSIRTQRYLRLILSHSGKPLTNNTMPKIEWAGCYQTNYISIGPFQRWCTSGLMFILFTEAIIIIAMIDIILYSILLIILSAIAYYIYKDNDITKRK